MAADVTSGCTLIADSKLSGFGIAVVNTAATADDTDYFDMDTILGVEVNVIYATATDDADGTPITTPMSWTQTTTNPDRVTIGSNVDNKRRDVVVFYLARSSTGGD